MRLLVLALACGSLGCAAGSLRTLPPLSPAVLARGAGLGFTPAELQAGRARYTPVCGRCHALPDPRIEPEGGWEDVFERMRHKSGESIEASRPVRAYVLSHRE